VAGNGNAIQPLNRFQLIVFDRAGSSIMSRLHTLWDEWRFGGYYSVHGWTARTIELSSIRCEVKLSDMLARMGSKAAEEETGTE